GEAGVVPHHLAGVIHDNGVELRANDVHHKQRIAWLHFCRVGLRDGEIWKRVWQWSRNEGQWLRCCECVAEAVMDRDCYLIRSTRLKSEKGHGMRRRIIVKISFPHRLAIVHRNADPRIDIGRQFEYSG